jgi:hypothetical protein
MRALDRFMNVSEAHIPLLVQKAEKLQDYLNQR